MDDLSIGVASTSHRTKKYEESDDEESQSMFTIGTVVRYYIAEGLFGQGYFGFGTAKEKYDDGSGDANESKYSVSEWRLGVGYSVKLLKQSYLIRCLVTDLLHGRIKIQMTNIYLTDTLWSRLDLRYSSLINVLFPGCHFIKSDFVITQRNPVQPSPFLYYPL
jgi:hypothetical protein